MSAGGTAARSSSREICPSEFVSSFFSEALAAAIRRCLASPQLRAAFGQAGRALVEAEFAEGGVIERTLTVYRDALALPARVSGEPSWPSAHATVQRMPSWTDSHGT